MTNRKIPKQAKARVLVFAARKRRRGGGAGGGCGGRREISLTSGEISVVGASAERSDSRGAGGRVVGKGGRRSVAASAGLPRRPPVFIPRRRRPPPAVAWLRLPPLLLPARHLPTFPSPARHRVPGAFTCCPLLIPGFRLRYWWVINSNRSSDEHSVGFDF